MKKTLILPCNENIFVKRIDPTTITEGGIVVPDQSVDRPAEGTIMAIGPEIITNGRRSETIARAMDENVNLRADDHYLFYSQTFDLGDHVMFGHFAGIDVTVDGDTYVKLLPDEIFCVLRTVEQPSEPTVEVGNV